MEKQKLSKVIINLMKGIIFKQQQPLLWQDILQFETAIIDYVSVIGLELIVDENEGYAYLNQQTQQDENNDIPQLIIKRQLSFTVSLLCVLLRKKMIESDTSGNINKVIITKEEITRLMQNFLPDKNDQTKVQDQIDTSIRKVIEIGFMKKVQNEVGYYEILRIIKAFVDADWLVDIDEKLEVYLQHGQ